MAKIFVTGAADGLGRLVAEGLLRAGHHVTVHARSLSRLEALRGLIDKGPWALLGISP